MEQGDYVAAQSGLADFLAAPNLPTPMRETVLAMQSDIHNRALMASARANRTRPRKQGRLLAADTQNFAARSELRGVQSDLFQMLPFTD